MEEIVDKQINKKEVMAFLEDADEPVIKEIVEAAVSLLPRDFRLPVNDEEIVD